MANPEHGEPVAKGLEARLGEVARLAVRSPEERVKVISLRA